MPPEFTSRRTVPAPRSTPPLSVTFMPRPAPAATVVRPSVCTNSAAGAGSGSGVPIVPASTCTVPAFSIRAAATIAPAGVSRLSVPAEVLRRTPLPLPASSCGAPAMTSVPAFCHVASAPGSPAPPSVRLPVSHVVAPCVRSVAPSWIAGVATPPLIVAWPVTVVMPCSKCPPWICAVAAVSVPGPRAPPVAGGHHELVGAAGRRQVERRTGADRERPDVERRSVVEGDGADAARTERAADLERAVR